MRRLPEAAELWDPLRHYLLALLPQAGCCLAMERSQQLQQLRSGDHWLEPRCRLRQSELQRWSECQHLPELERRPAQQH
jgi:hypothetical protein